MVYSGRWVAVEFCIMIFVVDLMYSASDVYWNVSQMSHIWGGAFVCMSDEVCFGTVENSRS